MLVFGFNADSVCFFVFSRYGGSSKSKQEYKPDVKLEYYDDNGRSLTPKEVLLCSLILMAQRISSYSNI